MNPLQFGLRLFVTPVKTNQNILLKLIGVLHTYSNKLSVSRQNKERKGSTILRILSIKGPSDNDKSKIFLSFDFEFFKCRDHSLPLGLLTDYGCEFTTGDGV